VFHVARKIKCIGHVARMERKGMHTRFWFESQKERDHYEDKDVDRIILKWI
jgi:hypothetical protein